MADAVKIVEGTPIVLANSATYSPTAANNLGTQTNQLNLASVANNAARQSDKFDFGANRAPLWRLDAAIEFAATPTAGLVVNFYLAPSHSSTAGHGNPGGVSGSDAAYTGYSSNLADSLRQLVFLGSLVTTAQATATVQVQRDIGRFMPPARYGTLIVENKSGASLHSDSVEMSVVLTPLEHQAQAV